MAYNKTIWENNVTPIDADKLNNMENGIEEINNAINGSKCMSKIIVEDIECKNLFNKNTVSTGFYLNTAGNLEVNTGYVVSDFIEVEEGETYFLPTRGTTRTKFYDSSKKATTDTWDVADGDISFVIPNGVKYIRFSIATTVSLNTFQFEKGSVATDYVEYKEISFTINDLIKKLVNIPGDFLKSTVNVDDLYNIQGIKVYPIWDQYPASMPYGAYQYGVLIVITQSTTNMFLNTQIYITDGVHNAPTDNVRGVYVRTGKFDWLRISGTRVSKKPASTSSTTSTTTSENLELTDI